MNHSTCVSEFFIAGGTLRPDAPSYVKRPADDELFNLALAGEFCYVLTPRQMGKSSLMARTAGRLKEQSVNVAIIDLTKIGTVAVDQWYLGMLTRLERQLKLSVEPEKWWQERASLGCVQRFTDFLRDMILAEIKGQVVIFIDEIDTTLKLDFTDDFFGAIRAVYNARADDPEFKRLTFVLLGVATPADLIKDRTRTPFNIGQGIPLQEFSQTDAAVLQAGLEVVCPSQGEAIFTRIYHWTNGHPYLTQKLCLSVAEADDGDWNDELIDRLVERLFFSEKARKETNLQFVRDGVQISPNRRRLLTIYRQVYKGEAVPDDKRSLDKNRLKLLGLVTSEGGVLKVRNEIYRRVFNLDWITANTPVNWTRHIAIASTAITLLLLSFFGYFILSRPQQSTAARAQAFIDSFRETTSTDVRVTNLAGLFQISGYEDRARALFFDEVPSEDQGALFEKANAQAVRNQLIIVVQGLYAHLDDNPAGNQLLQVMAQTLREIDGNVVAKNLATEIKEWLAGRGYAARENFKYAIEAYDTAIELNPDNIGTHFDRALAYTELGENEKALLDFDAVLEIVSRAPPTPTPTSSPMTSPTSTAIPTPTSIVTLTAPPVGNSPTPVLEAARTLTPEPTLTPTTMITMPSSSAQRFTSSEQIVARVEEVILANASLLSTWFASQSSYPSLARIAVVARSVSNIPPTAVISGPTSGRVGERLSFSGAGSTDDDGRIVSYVWDFGDGTIGSGVNVTHSYSAAGSYKVTLTVTDDGGLSDSAIAAVPPIATPVVAMATETPTATNTPAPSTLTTTPTQTPVPPTATATHTPRPPTPARTAIPTALSIVLRDTFLEGDVVRGAHGPPRMASVVYREGSLVYGEAIVEIGGTIYHFDKPEVGPGEPEQLPDPWRVTFEFDPTLLEHTGNRPWFDSKKAQFRVGWLDGSSAEVGGPYSLTMKLYEGNELRDSVGAGFMVIPPDFQRAYP